MTKDITNVSELLRKEGLDKDFRKEVKEEIAKKSLSKFLFILRCEHNLTQKQLADKIGCTQSKISKIESANDNELSVQNLLDYAKALKLDLEIGYRSKNAKIADLIKYHAIKIKTYLEYLSSLAQGDSQLDESIGKFHDEVLFDIINTILNSLSRLDYAKKRLPGHPGQHIHISPPLDLRVDEEELAESTS